MMIWTFRWFPDGEHMGSDNMAKSASASPWFSRRPRDKRARVIFFCLPFSGGGASAYNEWRELFPPQIEVCPVHLPGREARIEEPPNLSPDEIARAMADHIDLPFALYGHSMGARLGFEVLRKLSDLGVAAPLRFYPAASLPPDVTSTVDECVLLPDEAFINFLILRLGASENLRAIPELREFLLPLLRSDLEWCYNYRYHPDEPLETTIVALSGESDDEANPRNMAGWSRHGKHFNQLTVPGGHFFVKTAGRHLTEILANDLFEALAAPDAAGAPRAFPSGMTADRGTGDLR
jgi:surfactin synthase thioesterase subunit